ncbi:MAG: hypothetical protein WAW10_07680 [Gallionella sp.]
MPIALSNLFVGRFNDHGKPVLPDDETCHDRFPLSNFPPQAGERANDRFASFMLTRLRFSLWRAIKAGLIFTGSSCKNEQVAK